MWHFVSPNIVFGEDALNSLEELTGKRALIVTDNNLVQIEAQFGTVESMFKDFCGFRIAAFERRLSLGIEIILSNPNYYDVF